MYTACTHPVQARGVSMMKSLLPSAGVACLMTPLSDKWSSTYALLHASMDSSSIISAFTGAG